MAGHRRARATQEKSAGKEGSRSGKKAQEGWEIRREPGDRNAKRQSGANNALIMRLCRATSAPLDRLTSALEGQPVGADHDGLDNRPIENIRRGPFDDEIRSRATAAVASQRRRQSGSRRNPPPQDSYRQAAPRSRSSEMKPLFHRNDGLVCDGSPRVKPYPTHPASNL